MIKCGRKEGTMMDCVGMQLIALQLIQKTSNNLFFTL